MKIIAPVMTAALLVSAGTYAFAQGNNAPATSATPPAATQQTRGTSQDEFNRLVDARIAGVKAGLKLSADQERLWAPVETAVRNTATQRFNRFEQRRAMRDQQSSIDFMQRLEQRGTTMTENAQQTSALATAMRPLWNTFSDDQKRIAPRLLRSAVGGDGMGRSERGGRRGHDGDHDRGHGRMGGMMHQGPGMMGRGPQGPAQQP